MTEQIRPGLWVRWCDRDAPTGRWRLLEDILPTSYPRGMVYLVFADGFETLIHRGNLVVEHDGKVLWETSATRPAEVAS